MTPVVVAESLEYFAKRVRSIRPADHRNPHAFVEDKSDVVAEIMAEARRLRTMTTPRAPVRPVRDIPLGARAVGRREVQVVSRGRRLA